MKYIIVALLVTIVGLCIWGGIETYEEASLRNQLKVTNSQKVACDTANVTFQKQVSRQNASIKFLNDEVSSREAAAAKAVTAAQATRDKNTKAAAVILTQKVDANDCTGAQQVLQTYLKGRGR